MTFDHYLIISLSAALLSLLGSKTRLTTAHWWGALFILLFWPIAGVMSWARRERAAWRSPALHPVLWLHQTERRSRVRMPWRHRRVYSVGPLVIFLRPRPTLDWPLLLTPERLTLTPLLFQIHFQWMRPAPATRLV